MSNPTNTPQGQSTRAIHGTTLRDPHGAPHLPIYNTTTFAFENTGWLVPRSAPSGLSVDAPQ
jgi:cystathionine gamma-synthase